MPRAGNGRFTKAGSAARMAKLVGNRVERNIKRKISNAAKLLASDEEPTMLVHAGRRVVELDTLAKALWCTACDIPLSLRNLEKEQQMGLASIMTVRCRECLAVYAVHTSKKVPNLNGAKSLYASNCKAALGKSTSSSLCQLMSVSCEHVVSESKQCPNLVPILLQAALTVAWDLKS